MKFARFDGVPHVPLSSVTISLVWARTPLEGDPLGDVISFGNSPYLTEVFNLRRSFSVVGLASLWVVIWLSAVLSSICISLLVVSAVRRFVIVTKWFYLTRLETRTKESNIYASIRVLNPNAQ